MSTVLWIFSGILGIAACVAFAGHHRYVGLFISYAAICVGLGAITAVIYTAWTEQEASTIRPRLSFTANIVNGISGIHRGTMFGILYRMPDDRVFLLHITDVIFLEITNTSEFPMTIESYKLLAKGVAPSEDSWKKAYILNHSAEHIYVTGASFTTKEMAEINFINPLFDDAVRYVNIPANGGTAKGLLLVERPEGMDGPEREWRIGITDARGNSATEPIQGSMITSDGGYNVSSTLGIKFLHPGEYVDLSNVPLAYYSDIAFGDKETRKRWEEDK